MNNPNDLASPEIQRRHQFMTMMNIIEICLRNSVTDFSSPTVLDTEAATFKNCMGKMSFN